MPLYARIRAEALALDAPLGPFLFKRTARWLLGHFEVSPALRSMSGGELLQTVFMEGFVAQNKRSKVGVCVNQIRKLGR